MPICAWSCVTSEAARRSRQCAVVAPSTRRWGSRPSRASPWRHAPGRWIPARSCTSSAFAACRSTKSSVLNAESGVWALSGGRDIADVVLAAPDDDDAELAMNVYAYRVATAVASMGAALGGLDALAFTAGVGEHSPAIRAAVCARLEFLGVQLDRRLNERLASEGEIGEAGAAARVFVVSSREELVATRADRALSQTVRGRLARLRGSPRPVRG